MVNETPTANTATNATASQAELDDIMSSIRSGVQEEGGKVGSGSADLIDAAAAQDDAADEAADEADVLELSETDMLQAADGNAAGTAAESDELLDLDAFAANGEAKPAETQAEAVGPELQAAPAETAPAADSAGDEFDRLLAEISQEQQQQVAASAISKEALMAEEEPLGGQSGDVAADVPAEEVAAETAPLAAETVEPAEVEIPQKEMPQKLENAAPPRMSLSLVDGADGPQVALPAEILAMALRPMVQDWLAENLPAVVEKLVKDEISKLSQG